MLANIDQIFGNSSAAQTQNTGKKELGQEDFLELLVAQLKNQDPGNPADNGEFLSQIAQFSMVSGIDDLGESFDGIAGSFHSNQAMQAAEMVGKQVLTDSNVAHLDSTHSIEGLIEADGIADAITVQIKDAAGRVVHSVDLGTSEGGFKTFSWNGLDVDGLNYPEGNYKIEAAAIVNGKQEAMPVKVFSEIDSVSVDRNTGAIQLHLTSQEVASLSEVHEFR